MPNTNTVRKRRPGDRTDGRLLRTVSPMSTVALYIMKDRNDACNMFTDPVDIKEIEKYIAEKRKQGFKGLGMLHIIAAAYIRTVSKYPGINRFVSGQRIYARNDIQIMLTIKKTMEVHSPDTVIKAVFSPDADIKTVYDEINRQITDGKSGDDSSDFDRTADFLRRLPRPILRAVVKFLKFLDYFGWLPKFLLHVSPFHGSFFITSMGSLGIPPIYHHLYNFGNVPLFCSYGAKRTDYVNGPLGIPVEKKFVDCNYVMDERICDGHYYATAFKYLREILRNPQVLDNPPDEVTEDID
ncbi:MAG: hypothetical protein IJO74_03515 [Clostridia bacterium]|nr:hypothetical protein [Clostridia bacterium]